jgi:hypothetical protein
MSRRTPLLVALLGLSVASGARPASALPAVGDAPPAALVEDVDGKAVDPRGKGGRPVLVVYEDRDTSKDNAPLKADLRALAGESSRFSRLVVAPVADVSDYDYWPARGFVVRAIREEARRAGLPIYCDFTGAFRGALKLERRRSSVVLMGRDGRVLFAAEGPLSADARARVIALVRGEIGA